MGQEMTMNRRQVIGAGLIGGLMLAAPAWAWRESIASAPETVETVDLTVSAARATRMTVWRPARPKGVVLFSTGHGSWPERYAALAALLVGEGFAVLAPLHVDSVHYPDRDRFTLQQSFPERLADMRAASAWGASTWPGLPVLAVGHSFGTLTALCMGGALGGMGPFRDRAVRGVLGFSTPGKIPGLIGADAYATVAVPVMIVTGSADVVPGFVTDPADHLFPADTVKAGSYALVVDKADHGLVAEPALLAHAAPAVRLFVEAYGLGNGRAARLLPGWKAPQGDVWTVHPA